MRESTHMDGLTQPPADSRPSGTMQPSGATAQRSSRLRCSAGAAAIVVAIAVGVSACGGGGSDLSELADRGRQTALDNGCASCHGAKGQGGTGPAWIDLAGSERELEDGTTVVADDEYLLRSILEPNAEVVEGFSIAMRQNGLSEAQAADIVAYIKELTSDPE